MNDHLHCTKYITYWLIPTTKRLTFDIVCQETSTINDDGDVQFYKFVASNGYEIISRSRMDIQTERLWLLGSVSSGNGFRSGSMVFSSNEKRDVAEKEFVKAIEEWNVYIDEFLRNR